MPFWGNKFIAAAILFLLPGLVYAQEPSGITLRWTSAQPGTTVPKDVVFYLGKSSERDYLALQGTSGTCRNDSAEDRMCEASRRGVVQGWYASFGSLTFPTILTFHQGQFDSFTLDIPKRDKASFLAALKENFGNADPKLSTSKILIWMKHSTNIIFADPLGEDASFRVDIISSGQSTSKSTSKSQAYRLTMTECEGVDNCTNWTFLSSNGWKGYGKWRTGEEAVLDLESPEDGKIIIHRTDVRGSKEGLTATYEGTLSDDQMGGIFTYSYNGKTGSGRWYAILEASALSLPPVMHFCDVNCITLRQENGRYVNRITDAFADPNYSETWAVESFTRDSVVFHRTVTGKFAFHVTYRGQISRDGNSLINAANPFHGGAQPSNIMLAWGDALYTVPGSNAERDRIGGFQVAPSTQITARDVYEDARALRDVVLEIKKWNDFFQLFAPESK